MVSNENADTRGYTPPSTRRRLARPALVPRLGGKWEQHDGRDGVRLLSDPQNFRIFMVGPSGPAYFEISALQWDSAHVISARVGTVM
jgi:hypothetical protein